MAYLYTARAGKERLANFAGCLLMLPQHEAAHGCVERSEFYHAKSASIRQVVPMLLLSVSRSPAPASRLPKGN